MYPQQNSGVIAQASQMVTPKSAPLVELAANQMSANNEYLSKAVSRIEDALLRLGWHEDTAKANSSNVAPVPNGHIGALNERLQIADSLHARLHSLIDTLETYI